MNAYDAALHERLRLDADLAAAKQSRAINDYKLKRQPVLDQQADADRQRQLADEQTARDDAAALAKRQAQLRGLVTLKTAVDKGMSPVDAINALGPAGLKVFGDTFGDMATFARRAQEPGFLDAKIAGLRGDAKSKRIFKQDFVIGPEGKPGTLSTYDDGSTDFTTDYSEPAKAVSRAGLKQDPAGNLVDPYTGAVVVPANLQGVFDKSAADAAGTAAGKAGEDALPWTPVQKVNAKTTLDSLTLKNQNLNNAVDKAIAGVDWSSAGLAQAFKDAGGPPANLKALLTTVAAQIGLDELTKLKQSGVTLGQVTEAEHTLLQSMIANLAQAQDPQQLRDALIAIKAQSNKAWRITRDNLNQIAQAKGGFPGAAPGGAAPDPQSEPPKPKRSAQYYED